MARKVELLIKHSESGDLDSILQLLDDDPSLVHAVDEHRWTALHRAANFGHVEIVQLLLEAGADPNKPDLKKRTPLHDAATGHEFNVACMVLLVRAGAKLEVRNTYWQTPLMVAVHYSNLPGFLYLLGCGARIDLLDRQRMDPLQMAKHQLEGNKGRKFARQRSDLRTIIEVLEALSKDRT